MSWLEQLRADLDLGGRPARECLQELAGSCFHRLKKSLPPAQNKDMGKRFEVVVD